MPPMVVIASRKPSPESSGLARRATVWAVITLVPCLGRVQGLMQSADDVRGEIRRAVSRLYTHYTLLYHYIGVARNQPRALHIRPAGSGARRRLRVRPRMSVKAALGPSGPFLAILAILPHFNALGIDLPRLPIEAPEI